MVLTPVARRSCGAVRRPLLRWALVASLALGGLIYLLSAADSLRPARVYHKDFLSPYLLGSAVLRGLNPYLPLPELADGVLQLPADVPFFHPSPHPPAVAL